MTSHRPAAPVIAAMAMACLFLAPDVEAAPLPGDARRGADLYESRCGACHALDANRVGPRHRGVFGRKAGTAPGFAYTPALKASGLVWTAANLDRWLTAPTSMVKGTAMGYRLPTPKDRADVVAYLASPAVSPPPKRRR